MRGTENIPHHFDEFKRAIIVDEIKNTIGFLFGAQYVFLPENRQMLRNIALTGSDLLDNVLYANRIVAEDA